MDKGRKTRSSSLSRRFYNRVCGYNCGGKFVEGDQSQAASGGHAGVAAGGRFRRAEGAAGGIRERGTGSAQYHPRMMLALLIYATRTGYSRRIERAGISNSHPDQHDLRVPSQELRGGRGDVEQVLLLARRVGTVSVDGTNKRNSIRYDRRKTLRSQLRGEVEELLEPEREDAHPQALPEELREQLKSKLDEAAAANDRKVASRERFRASG